MNKRTLSLLCAGSAAASALTGTANAQFVYSPNYFETIGDVFVEDTLTGGGDSNSTFFGVFDFTVSHSGPGIDGTGHTYGLADQFGCEFTINEGTSGPSGYAIADAYAFGVTVSETTDVVAAWDYTQVGSGFDTPPFVYFAITDLGTGTVLLDESTLGTAGTQTLTLSTGTSYEFDIYIRSDFNASSDSLSMFANISAIPAPGTVGLAVVGFAAAGARRRRLDA